MKRIHAFLISFAVCLCLTLILLFAVNRVYSGFDISKTDVYDTDNSADAAYMTTDIEISTLEIPLLNIVEIKAPENYSVFVDGELLDADYIIDSSRDNEYYVLPVNNPYAVEYVTYFFFATTDKPTVTAKDFRGGDVTDIQHTDGDLMYTVSPNTEWTLSDDIKSVVLSSSESYAAYMQKDASFQTVAQYVDSSSDVYYKLYTSDVVWVTAHSGYSIENAEISELVFYDENTFSCRVKFDHMLYGYGTSFTDPFDMIFYYRKDGDSFKIFDSKVGGSANSVDEAADKSLLSDWNSDGVQLYCEYESSFKAYVLLIKDPSKVQVGVSTEDYSSATIGSDLYTIASKYNAIAAINAGEFNDTGGNGSGAKPMGITYSEGNCVWNDSLYRTFIGFDKDNNLIVQEGMNKSTAEALGIRDGVSFQTGNVLIQTTEQGTQIYNSSNNRAAQRTAIGQRSDGAVIMIVTDGREASSIGATRNEMINLLLSYGAVNAAMLDGGSSAVMYYENYFEKYDFDTQKLDSLQLSGLLNKYKAFCSPRTMPTYFVVSK